MEHPLLNVRRPPRFIGTSQPALTNRWALEQIRNIATDAGVFLDNDGPISRDLWKAILDLSVHFENLKARG